MQVEIEIDERLKNRDDLIQIVNAAADYLVSRDKDPDSQVRAHWRLRPTASGNTEIALRLNDHDYSATHTFAPEQLAPADIRRLRLESHWTDLLLEQAWRANRRVNELLLQYEGD